MKVRIWYGSSVWYARPCCNAWKRSLIWSFSLLSAHENEIYGRLPEGAWGFRTRVWKLGQLKQFQIFIWLDFMVKIHSRTHKKGTLNDFPGLTITLLIQMFLTEPINGLVRLHSAIYSPVVRTIWLEAPICHARFQTICATVTMSCPNI